MKYSNIRIEDAPDQGPDYMRISWEVDGLGYAVFRPRTVLARGAQQFAEQWMKEFAEADEE